MKALTLSATSRRKPLVILTGPNIEAKYSPNHFRGSAKMIYRTLSTAFRRLRCNCTPRRFVAAAFGKSFSIAVGIALISFVWWHNLTIGNAVEAQAAVARDVLFAMPWGIVWAVRLSRMPLTEEGGEE